MASSSQPFPSSSAMASPEHARLIRKLPTRTYGKPRPPPSPALDEADKSSATLVDFDLSPIASKRSKEMILDELQQSISSQETRVGADDQRDDNNDNGLNRFKPNFSRNQDVLRSQSKFQEIPASSDAEEGSEEPYQFPWQLKLKEIDRMALEDSPTTSAQELAAADTSIAISPPTTPLSSRGSPPLPTKKSRAKPLLGLDSDSAPSIGSSKRATPAFAESDDAASMPELDAKGKRKRTTRAGKQKQKAPKGLTKKEQEESRREQARIVREQRVSIARPEDRGNVSMRHVSELAPLLFKSKAVDRLHESSDPIRPWSSPAKSKVNNPPALPPKRTVMTLDEMPAAPLSDSDTELPTLKQVMEQQQAKRVKDQIRQKLQEQKLHFLSLQKQRQNAQPQSDDDDDLEVVQVRKAPPPLPLLERRRPPAAVARPSMGGNKAKNALTNNLLTRAEAQKREGIEKKEAEFIKRGGVVRSGILEDGQEKRDAWLARLCNAGALKTQPEGDGNEGDGEGSEDEEWKPEEHAADRSPSPGIQYSGEEENSVSLEINGSGAETEPDENEVVPRRRARKSNVVDSDDEGTAKILVPDTSILHFSQTQPQRQHVPVDDAETDKENDMDLIFDEDKENTLSLPSGSMPRSPSSQEDKENALVRQPLALALGRTHTRSPSLSPAFNRMPFKELRGEDDDDQDGSPLVAPMFGAGPEDNAAGDGSPKPGGFSQLFGSGSVRKLSFGFPSQALTGSKKPSRGGFEALRMDSEPSLTFDVGLQPALDVSSSARERADAIFAREQDDVVEAANAIKPKVKPTLYVDENGFLTQTRPTGTNPEMYKPPPTQKQYSEPSGSSLLTQPRRPLGTLALLDSQLSQDSDLDEDNDDKPVKRLRRYGSSSPTSTSRHRPSPSISPSPTPSRVRTKVVKVQGKKPAAPVLGKSIYVAGEAQESDEDDGFGFGIKAPKDDGDEEDSDADNDKTLEGLVNDEVMDATVVAEDKVVEKYQEQAVADDEALEKYHRDAIEGKFRTKRSRRGVDLSDDESDDETREANRKVKLKKRRVEDDSLDALGENEDTKAFALAYYKGINEEETSLFPEEDSVMVDADAEEQDGEDEDEENAEPQSISVREIAARVREVVQQEPEEAFNPRDLGWLDDHEEDSETRTRIFSRKTIVRPPTTDVNHMRFQKPEEKELARYQIWAKQNEKTTVGAYAPTGGSVTARPKAGISKQRAAASSASAGPSRLEQRKSTTSSNASMLSVVSSKRKGFESQT